MKSVELIRKLKRVAKRRGENWSITPAKGSHQKAYLGLRQSVIPIHNSELPSGTFNKILNDLNVKERELYEK